MAEDRDYYEILGIDKSADEDTIKRAYRQQAKKYHPDQHPGDAEAEKCFKEVNEAYSILSDPDKRAKYDQYGKAAFDPTAGAGAGGFGGGFSDFGDLGSIFGDLFGGAFGGAFSGGSTRRSGPQRGDDIGARVTVSFEEAVFGCKKEVNYARLHKCPACGGTGAEAGSTSETCPDCHGTGQRTVVQRMGGMQFQSKTACEKCRGTGRYIKTPCQKCRGTGLEKETRSINVSIPAGIDNGESIAARGQGNEGKNGGSAGDLIIQINVRSHNLFRREGVDLFCDVPLTIAEATLGAEIDVPTLEGPVKYTISEGTQSGTSYTLRGKGVPYINNQSRRGDLTFTVNVEIPRSLNEKQREAMRSFAEQCGEKNYAKQSKFKSFVNKIKGKDA